jgi:NAD(P)-dependent dehydrogenase (short-subunit alcohol dehydrogenase family)
MQKANPKKALRKQQSQRRPGKEFAMDPQPASQPVNDERGKLNGKTALITGGDSGIGKAVAILFAKEGADIAIGFLNEKVDAEETKKEVEAYGRKCFLFPSDLGKENNCKKIVEDAVKKLGKIDILVNNAAMHWEQKSIEDISTEQLLKTFNSNFFSYFWVTKYTMKHLKKGAVIINTTSVTAYRGSGALIDYASTKGAIVSFTRSLAANLVEKGIRVNGVAPGPIWTPLIVSTFDKKKVAQFGSDVPMKRAGETNEVAPCFLFLASEDSSYMTGQVLHPNGGEIVNG